MSVPIRRLENTWPRNRSEKWKRLRPYPEWMLGIRIGDVLRSRAKGADVFRVVRAINRRPDGEPYCVQVVKRRRSGYPTPVTILYAGELLTRGFAPAGVRIKLDKEIDKRIACSIQKHLDCPVFAHEREVVGMVA